MVKLAIPRWVVAILALSLTVVVMGLLYGRNAVQAAIQGIVVGSVYVLGASGLSLLYGIKKFANFAHGDMMTIGAYVAFTVNVWMGADILLGVVGAMLTVACVGMVLELAVFRRLERRGPVPALIASVGVGLVLQNTLGAIFLGDVRYLLVAIPPDFPVGGTGLRFNQLSGITLAVAVGLTMFLHVLLKYTTLGKAMRACADDLDLARTSGIDTRNVILWTWAISGALAAVAGVLLGILINVTPTLGFFVLLFIFAAVIVGGIGSPYGAMIGGLVIGLVQKLSAVVFADLQNRGILEGGSAYEPAGAFLIMIVVLLLKPEGIMGASRERVGRWRLRWPFRPRTQEPVHVS
jgi:branched-chain amino acid transport system permease protein/neutral amino acid transport system permease protein